MGVWLMLGLYVTLWQCPLAQYTCLQVSHYDPVADSLTRVPFTVTFEAGTLDSVDWQ